jgi:hypothetical protein
MLCMPAAWSNLRYALAGAAALAMATASSAARDNPATYLNPNFTPGVM